MTLKVSTSSSGTEWQPPGVMGLSEKRKDVSKKNLASRLAHSYPIQNVGASKRTSPCRGGCGDDGEGDKSVGDYHAHWWDTSLLSHDSLLSSSSQEHKLFLLTHQNFLLTGAFVNQGEEG